jgi:hypothetical protein
MRIRGLWRLKAAWWRIRAAIRTRAALIARAALRVRAALPTRTSLRARADRARHWLLFESEPTVHRILVPINVVLCWVLRFRVWPRSVLHISYMVHVPHHMVTHLRRQGMKADYLAIGASPYWNKCDYNYLPQPVPFYRLLEEFRMFWQVVARYEVVHAHFMFNLTQSGWELPLLKRMGRVVVVNFRGCEARDRTRNMALHPDLNICSECDHHPPICQSDSARRRRELARHFGDAVVVTTPDMRDFVPEGIHFPFFTPPESDTAPPSPERTAGDRAFVIMHVTAQPGIEGTHHIEAVIKRLQAKGRRIRWVWLSNVTHDTVMASLPQADLAIGKMKMGYYANAQIESMMSGVPTITYVRPEFMTEELRRSGFIFATLKTLEATIEHYIDHPEELAAKRRIARDSILRLHDNDALAQRLMGIYRDAALSRKIDASPKTWLRRTNLRVES